MSLHALANHMAAKGRGGDSMMVHMSADEVKALQALAKRHGTSLTINPETGQPEAFSLRSLLPTIIGAGLSIASGGTLTPMMAAMITGAGYTAATGSLQKGLMAGFGAWGGAGLGAGLNAAAAATPVSDVAAATGQAGLGFSDVAAGVPEAAGAVPTTVAPATTAAGMQSIPGVPGLEVTNALPTATPTTTAMPELVPPASVPAPAAASVTEPGMLDRFSSGIKALGTEEGRAAFMGQAGSKGVEATGVGGVGGLTKYGVAALAPSLLEPPNYTPYQGSGPNPYNFAFNWERPYGPRYDSREAQQLYGRMRLMAEGGETTDKEQPTAPAVVAEPSRYMGMTGASADAMRYLMGESAVSPAAQAAQNYMANRPVGPIQTPITIPETPSAPSSALGRMLGRVSGSDTATTTGIPTFAFDPSTGRMRAIAAPVVPVVPETVTALPTDYTGGYADGGITALAMGGASHLGGYSDGGRLLRGPGDGVSDSIPATIGDRQPARLADGEFVVPARIVSELGNGSTEAGARKLYAMMDRVQKARGKTVGKGQVAANSRADKALPA